MQFKKIFIFLINFPRIPASILMLIISKFIIEQQYGTQIKAQLKNDLGVTLNIATIDKILKWIWVAFAHYIKDIYLLNKLGKNNGGNNISIDESLFTHINWEIIWVVGAKNNKTTNIRLNIFKHRGEEEMKIFIFNHIKEKNNIITMVGHLTIF